MTTEQWTIAAFILAPIVILGLAGVARGYHLDLKIWRGHRKDSDNGND